MARTAPLLGCRGQFVNCLGHLGGFAPWGLKNTRAQPGDCYDSAGRWLRWCLAPSRPYTDAGEKNDHPEIQPEQQISPIAFLITALEVQPVNPASLILHFEFALHDREIVDENILNVGFGKKEGSTKLDIPSFATISFPKPDPLPRRNTCRGPYNQRPHSPVEGHALALFAWHEPRTGKAKPRRARVIQLFGPQASRLKFNAHWHSPLSVSIPVILPLSHVFPSPRLRDSAVQFGVGEFARSFAMMPGRCFST